MESGAYPLLLGGREALARGDWQEARTCFTAALKEQETAAAFDGLGMAAWWLNDAAATFDARHRAYQLYNITGDVRSAARIAAFLALDYFYFRGEYAVANGWVERGRRLVEGIPPGPELGWLDLAQVYIILWADLDYVVGQQLCAQVITLAKALGDVDLEMAALAAEGLAFVNQGQIGEGMRRLDQSTLAATSGDVKEIDAACTACCCLIFACEWTRDYERAAQWIARLRDLATRWSHPTLLAFCQVHYASLLIWRGDWAEAEAELLAAIGNLETTQQPARVAEGLVRLAELRCRQGQFAAADALLTKVESPAFQSLAAGYCLYGRATLALEQTRLETAVNLAGRFLRTLPAENRLERVIGWELLIQAEAQLGHVTQAQMALAELKAAVAHVTTNPMQAAVRYAEGITAAAAADYSLARRCLEDALELWHRAGVPFECGRSRLQLAYTLLSLGQEQAARQQAAKALALFTQLGAEAYQARAAAFLHQPDPPTPTIPPPDTPPLTPRELEILSLLAAGLSNQVISHNLVLSVRTVERHISNIYSKLDLTGPAARAAATAYALQHHLVKRD
ncbi:MAG: helix-turn-helix transcriptional regulator [Anaerolineae bacterium]|nr:helix-turn-helix transcriptional regulator [Anaerolineae bacterium]